MWPSRSKLSSASPDPPRELLRRPIAHRGLHDRAAGIVENSRAAVKAAVAAGYAIEIDVQRAACGEAMVFHDATLDRTTDARGPLATRRAPELAHVTLTASTENVPTLAEILVLVAGRVPLLIEVKDQDGALGRNVGPLEDRVGALLAGYRGPVAVMSFNPEAVAAMARSACHVARGLTTCGFPEADWPAVSADRRARLARLDDIGRVGASFVSHDHRDLATPALDPARAAGRPILAWTIRSEDEERAARRRAHNITFEGFRPAIPA